MAIKSSVSLYSLQFQYLQGNMNLDEIIGFVKGLGAEGIELLPDQMLHGTPEPTEETYAEWDALMEKHKIGLACDDIFLNTNLYKNRELTKRECIDLIKKEIVMADRLGFRRIRLVSMVPAWVLEPCLETAEKHDVSLSIEIHGGLGFGVPKTEEYIEEMLRLGSKYIGVVPDMSLYMQRPPRICTNYCDKVLGGLNPKLVEYVDKVYADGGDFFRMGIDMSNAAEKLGDLIQNEADAFYATNLGGYEQRPISELEDLADHILHVHFKFYEMTEEGEEWSIDYLPMIEFLHKHNYDGYVSSEYEGNRWILPDLPIPEVEQVTRHQKMVQKLIKQVEG